MDDPAILTAIPPQILQQVQAHLAGLRTFNAGIPRMRALEQRVGSAGRYEADFRHAREAAAQQSQAWLDRFAALARTNGVDAEAVFTALGGRPILEPWSPAAQAWQQPLQPLERGDRDANDHMLLSQSG